MDDNLTWVIGEFRIYVIPSEPDTPPGWQYSVRHDYGWEITGAHNERLDALVEALNIADAVQGCNYRLDYSVTVEGVPYVVNAMPQNRVAHVIIDALEQAGLYADDVDSLHQWQVHGSDGREIERTHHIHVYNNFMPLSITRVTETA